MYLIRVPHMGIPLLSAFITMDDMVMVTGTASKYEGCGAKGQDGRLSR